MSFNSDSGKDEDKNSGQNWPAAIENIGCFICIVLIVAIWAWVEVNT